MHLGQLFFLPPSVEFLSYDNAIIFLGCTVEFALCTRMQLSATSRSLYARRVTRKGWTSTALGKICISLYSRSLSLSFSIPMTHDHRIVLEVHVESPYTVISPTFHVAHTLRRNSSFLNRSVYNFVRSSRLID